MPLKKALCRGRGWGVTLWVKYLPAVGAQASNPSSWKKAGRPEVQGYRPVYLEFRIGIGILRPCLQNNIIWLINFKIKSSSRQVVEYGDKLELGELIFFFFEFKFSVVCV